MEPPEPGSMLATLGLAGDDIGPGTADTRGGLRWAFRRQGEAMCLLCLYGPGETGASDAEHEMRAMHAAGDSGLRVPRVLANGVCDGRAMIALGLPPGQPLGEVVARRPTLARALGRESGALHARLHRVQPEGLRAVPASEWLERTGDQALAEAAHATFGGGERLCHFGFHPLNIFATQGGVTGIAGFEQARTGDPRADLGLSWAVLLYAPLPARLAARAAGTVRRRLAAGWQEGYTGESGNFPLTPLARATGLAVLAQAIEAGNARASRWTSRREMDRLQQALLEARHAAGVPVTKTGS